MSEKALLLVDDEASIIAALRRELARWARTQGLNILSASSAEEAERIIAEAGGTVSLLVTDVHMPGRSGLDLVHAVREASPDTISLLLTGYAELPEVIKAVREGAFAYLLKPWDSDYLRAELEKAWAIFQLRERERTHALHIEEDLRWAGELQQSLFCGPLPKAPWIRFSSVYQPQSEMKCSGDYLDVLSHDGRSFTLLVGDVAGHGVRAALVATFLKALVGAIFAEPPVSGGTVRLDDVFAALNDRICGSLPESLGMMITLAACTVDPSRGTLEVVSAGHPPTLIRRAGLVQALSAPGLPLGTRAGTVYETRSVPLSDGDLLVLYTDGLIERREEAIGTGGKRLEAAVGGETVDDDLAARLARSLAPSGGYQDDVTVLTAAITTTAWR